MRTITIQKRLTVAALALAVLVVGLLDSPVMAGYIFGPASDDFTYLGPDQGGTATKWEPGTNSASFHYFTPPDGPMTPGEATWSIMGAGFTDASGLDTDHGVNLTSTITALGVLGYAAADYAADINAALDVWASVSLFTNLGQAADGAVNAGASQASGGHLGDIRVAAWEITTTGVLAHAYQPGTEAQFGAGGTLGGDMHFDVDRTWVDNPDDITGNGMYDFYSIALHELGHSLGLGHSSVSASVMWPYYSGAHRTLHADDTAGIQALYGIPEPATIALLGFGALGLIRRKPVV